MSTEQTSFKVQKTLVYASPFGRMKPVFSFAVLFHEALGFRSSLCDSKRLDIRCPCVRRPCVDKHDSASLHGASPYGDLKNSGSIMVVPRKDCNVFKPIFVETRGRILHFKRTADAPGSKSGCRKDLSVIPHLHLGNPKPKTIGLRENLQPCS